MEGKGGENIEIRGKSQRIRLNYGVNWDELVETRNPAFFTMCYIPSSGYRVS